VVRKGVLLPVDEMIIRCDLERIGFDGSAAMGGGPEPDNMGVEFCQAIEPVLCVMLDSNLDCHVCIIP